MLGFGDVITPGPIELEYPTLLSFPAPTVRAYSKESVVAEKFEATSCLPVIRPESLASVTGGCNILESDSSGLSKSPPPEACHYLPLRMLAVCGCGIIPEHGRAADLALPHPAPFGLGRHG
jgi:nucleotidyltransferase AbiEii toxin of type IV toxin-antitoxin system